MVKTFVVQKLRNKDKAEEFTSPRLYAHIIYYQPNNATLCDKIESVQYNAALAITGAIRGTSRYQLYQELGLENLSDHRLVKFLRCERFLFTISCPSTASKKIFLQ